jgi:hypothetical protein
MIIYIVNEIMMIMLIFTYDEVRVQLAVHNSKDHLATLP